MRIQCLGRGGSHSLGSAPGASQVSWAVYFKSQPEVHMKLMFGIAGSAFVPLCLCPVPPVLVTVLSVNFFTGGTAQEKCGVLPASSPSLLGLPGVFSKP